MVNVHSTNWHSTGKEETTALNQLALHWKGGDQETAEDLKMIKFYSRIAFGFFSFQIR
jgi:hypothetical protein